MRSENGEMLISKLVIELKSCSIKVESAENTIFPICMWKLGRNNGDCVGFEQQTWYLNYIEATNYG